MSSYKTILTAVSLIVIIRIVSALSDRQLVMYLCQRRAVLSLQCTNDSAVSIECLVPLRTVMTPYTMLQDNVIVCKASDSYSPFPVLQLARASTHDCLLDNDCELSGILAVGHPGLCPGRIYMLNTFYRFPPTWLQPLANGDCRRNLAMVSSR